MIQSRKIATVTHPLYTVRVNRAFNGMSLAGASIYCSPRHPSALQIDPPANDGDFASMIHAR